MVVLFVPVCVLSYGWGSACESAQVDQRFANGSQGRLMYWTPSKVDGNRPIPSSHPELMARFVKESSLTAKTELLPDVDFIDVSVRNETIQAMSGEPVLVQLPLAPCYGLTVLAKKTIIQEHAPTQLSANIQSFSLRCTKRKP